MRRIALGLAMCWPLLSGCDPEAPAPTPKARPTPATVVSVAPSPAATGQLVAADAPAPGAAEPLPAPPAVKGASSGAPLAVAVATPRGKVEGVVRPTVTFNKPVRPLGAPEDLTPPARLSPPLPGAWKWLGSATLQFVPSEPAPLSTSFELQVPAGLAALDGTTLSEDFAVRFETPRLRPVDGDPVNNWRAHAWVRPDQRFTVVFDQRPTRDSLIEAIRLRSPDGETTINVLGMQTLAEKRAKANANDGVPAAPDAGSETAADRRVEVTLTPSTPLQADTDYTLVFGRGLRSSEGALPTEKEYRWAFRTYGPLRVKAVGCPRWRNPCSSGPLRLDFSNPVTAAQVKKALRIEPAVQIRWPDDLTIDNAEWILDGAFEPATTYRVSMTGLDDVFGQKQIGPFDGAFATGDMDPRFDMTEGKVVLERGLRAALPMMHVNVPQVDVGFARLSPKDALPWLLSPWRKEDPSGMHWGSRGLPGKANRITRSPLDLNTLMTGSAEGHIALVRTRRQEGKYTARTATLAQITDLGVHAKTSPNDVTLWVWKMSDGRPAAGATAEILDKEGTVLANGAADATGIIELPGVDAMKLPTKDQYGNALHDPPELIAKVQLGDDVLLVRLDDVWPLSPYRFGLPSAWENSAPQAEGLLFSDRGIYRPGEKVFLKGALRERVLGKLQTPAGRMVELAVRDPKGKTVSTTKHTLTRFGGFATELRLPAGVVGRYQFDVKDPSTKLTWGTQARVAEYRAPAFLVDVIPEPSARFAGQTVKAQVEGRYLFGAAMAGAAVDWTLLAAPGRFTLDDDDGHVYGRRVNWWDDDPSAKEVARGSWTLDQKGAFAFEGPAAETPGDRPQHYTLEAAVTDVDRQVVAGRARFPVHPAAFYVGVRGPAGFATAGEAFPVSITARDAADQRRVEAREIRVRLVRHVWHTVKKKNAWGAYETISERQPKDVGDACVISVQAARAGQCVLNADKAGYHEIVAEAVDAKGRTTQTTDPLWVVGEGYAAWLKDDDNKVEVVSDRGTYDVGDTVRVLVQSPYPEAEAWITVEREGVLWQKRTRLKGTATPVDIPVTADMIPNAFIGVVLARGRVAPPGTPGDPGRPSFRVGYRQVRVVPNQKRLMVNLSPDAEEKRPDTELSIAVEVKDHLGKGVESEVAVWAVDAGVLALTGYKTPDPLAALYRPRGLSVRQANPLLGLVPQLAYGEKGKPVGGGGGFGDEGSKVRHRFVTTPIFFGTAVTDAQGKTTVRGRLPDNLTTFRLMAVAVDAGDRAGHGESKVVVTKPLLARPALPRTVRVGDRFAAGVVVHAHQTDQPMLVEVSAGLTGPVEGLEGLTRTLTVPPDRGLEVRFAFRAKAPGVAVLRFKVTGGGHSDVVELPLPVKSPARLETIATYGVTEGEAVEALAPPGGIRSDMGGLSVTLAGSALTGLGDAAETLVEYPYGCLEQQSSRLIPFVALQKLLEQQQASWLGERRPEEVVATAVRALASMQRPDGGFAYWPGGGRSHFWGTAYATLATHGAGRAGYATADVSLERAAKYLQKRLDTTGRQAVTGASRAFGLYVLARLGKPERAHARRLFDDRARLPLFGQALLASALASSGDNSRAETMVTALMNQARVTAASVHFQESDPDTHAPLFSSDLRTTAMALQALLAVAPEHVYVPRIVQHLLDARKQGGGYRTTQEAAYALLALHDYAQIKEPGQPDLRAAVTLGGKALAEQHFTSAGQVAMVQRLTAAELPGGKTDLTFKAVGTGRLYYGARLQYAPRIMPTDPQDRGVVVQRWYTTGEGKTQVRAVTEGSLVQVHLRLATHQERHYLAVEDPLPAGLEAVDPRLKTSAVGAPKRADGARRLDGHPEPWSSPFGNVEMRDDRVLLFADHLPPGVYTYSYTARATTAGTFALPPATAEAMYRPEVNGRSDGGTFWVHPQATTAQR